MLTAVAWVFLVGAAIDFGVLALRSSSRLAWFFTFGASFGAVVCLALLFTLLARSLRQLGYVSEYKPRRAAARPARRRAGRAADPGAGGHTRSRTSDPSAPSDSRAQ